MLALTVKQPWASLLIHHGKDIENRSWQLSKQMIGQRIAIHSSSRIELYEWEAALDLIESAGMPIPDIRPINLILGSILGTLTFQACVRESKSPWFAGPYGFVVQRPKPLRVPIKAKGRLGFWKIPADIAREVAA